MLLEKAKERPPKPRQVSAGRPQVLELTTHVLRIAGRPMRAREIHAAAEALRGERLKWPSVKCVLSAYTIGGDHRFHRIRRGVYELRPLE